MSSPVLCYKHIWLSKILISDASLAQRCVQSCLQLRYDVQSSKLNYFFIIPNLQNKYWRNDNKYLATFYFPIRLETKIGNFRNGILQRNE